MNKAVNAPTTPTENVPTTGAPTENAPYRLAFVELEPEIAAVAAAELVPMTLDVPATVEVGVGSEPEILAYADAAAQLPGLDIQRFRQIGKYARAAGHAHAMSLLAAQPASELEDLHAECVRLRGLLLSDATALVNRGLLNGDRFHELRGPNGYRNASYDVTALVELFRASWVAVSAKTALTAAELEAAEAAATRLADAIAYRENLPKTSAELALTRQRAFTLYVRAYDQVRRAITYLRWNEGDVDSIAPSLYSTRSARRGASSEPNPPNDTTQPPGPPAAAPALAAVPPGFPGSSPFIA